MASFRDGAGREWHVAIDVALLERVDSRTGVRVDRLIRDQMAGLIELLDDPVKLVRVLWALCEEQAEKLGIQPEQFGRALYGDPLEDAARAFVGALADFCPSRARRLLRELVTRGEEAADRHLETALAELERTSSGSATSSPASSESTPAPAG